MQSKSHQTATVQPTTTLPSTSAAKVAEEVVADTILLYANCAERTAFGDYAQAGEVAYALDQHCKTSGLPQQMVLTSSKEGIENFKQLYLRHPGDKTLTIHGASFGFATLEEIIVSDRSKKVSHFVKVTACGKLDLKLVDRATNPNTKFLYLGGISNPDSGSVTLATMHEVHFMQVNPSAKKSDRVSSANLGIGLNRIGMPIYHGPYETLDHKAYSQVTTQPFGFAYFIDVGGCKFHQASFAGDYMRISYQSRFRASNYVFIGNDDDIVFGIRQFLNENRRLKVLLYPTNRVTQSYALSADGTFHVEAVADNQYDDNQSVVKVVALKKVPHEQMRVLMYSSIPFVGLAGAMSMLEAFALGKIVLNPILPNNMSFYSGYLAALNNDPNIASSPYSGRIPKLANDHLLWNSCLGLRDTGIRVVVDALNDEKLCTVLSAGHIRATQSKDAGRQIWQRLQNPVPSSAFATSSVAGTSTMDAQLRNSSLLMSPLSFILDLMMLGQASVPAQQAGSSSNLSGYSPAVSSIGSPLVFFSQNSSRSTTRQVSLPASSTVLIIDDDLPSPFSAATATKEDKDLARSSSASTVVIEEDDEDLASSSSVQTPSDPRATNDAKVTPVNLLAKQVPAGGSSTGSAANASNGESVNASNMLPSRVVDDYFPRPSTVPSTLHFPRSDLHFTSSRGVSRTSSANMNSRPQ